MHRHSRDHSPSYSNQSHSHGHSRMTNSIMLDVVKENSNDSHQSHHRHHSITKSSHGNFLGDNNPHINPNYNNDSSGYKAPLDEVDIEGSAYNIYSSNISNKSGADLYVSHVGDRVEEGTVVQVNRGKGLEVSSRKDNMRASVIGTRHLGSRMISENTKERIISESFVNLPERVIDNKPAPRRSIRKSVAHLVEEEPVIVEKIVEKEVEVIVERIVPKKVYKDVPYDVYVEQPIERIIEKEIEVEQIIEKEIEKTIEIPVERIIEIPVEEVVEKRVEVIKYVDVPRV